MVLRPREKGTKDTFRWVGNSEKRKPRQIRCQPFIYLVFEMMNWDFSCKYKVYVSKEESEGEAVLFAELSEYEKYEIEDETQKLSRTSILPAEYEHHFGNTVAQQRQSHFNIYEDMAVFEIAINTRKKQSGLPEIQTQDSNGGDDNGNN